MCKDYRYKGMRIYQNEGTRFDSTYFTVFNPITQLHVHASNKKAAERIVDCFCKLRNTSNISRFPRDIRNRCMRIAGYYVKSI